MIHVGQPECAIQGCILALFREELAYRFLGDCSDRDGNQGNKHQIKQGMMLELLTGRIRLV